MDIHVTTSWKEVIEIEIQKTYWNNLSSVVDKAYQTSNVCPPKNNIFACFNYFNYQDTKVVILGQDPYPTPNDANGLAFSVNRSNNLPHSLKNIFTELKNDLQIERTNGDLSDWAKQGVLLLNTSLTFCKDCLELLTLWKPFTNSIIEFIAKNVDNVIFVLWGNHAKSFKEIICKHTNLLIESGHPSFAQSHKQFFNTHPFSKVNNLLKSMNKQEIKW